jgi:hypothetical protein
LSESNIAGTRIRFRVIKTTLVQRTTMLL